jgi:hypothetical protein
MDMSLQEQEHKGQVTGLEFDKSVMKAAKEGARKAGIRHPIFAFDNDSIHNQAKLNLQLGTERLDVPVWSPDIMKVIEHNHEYVTEAFRTELDKNPDENYKTTTYKRLLMKAFEDESTPKRVGADVDSLKATLNEIIKLGGEYPDKRFR